MTGPSVHPTVPPITILRLYVVGESPLSVRAARRVEQWCERNLKDLYELEVIDVLTQPLRSLEDGIFVSPTLVRVAPKPTWRVVGHMDESQLAGLMPAEEH